MDCASNKVSSLHTFNGANETWKKYTLEIVNLLSTCSTPIMIREFNDLLLENRDIKKQYKLAISALDSILIKENKKSNSHSDWSEREKDLVENGGMENNMENFRKMKNSISQRENIYTENNKPEFACINSNELKQNTYVEHQSGHKNILPCIPEKCKPTSDFMPESLDSNETTLQEHLGFHISLNKKTEVAQVEDQFPFLERKSNFAQMESLLSKDNKNNLQIPQEEYDKLERELELTYAINSNLKKELSQKNEENEKLRDRVHSLEISLRTLTEAVNLQDEQLNEYGTVVTTLKASRNSLIKNLKESNERNTHNIMIVGSIENEVVQLSRQLDAYKEVLINQNIEHSDKASGTDQTFEGHGPHNEIIKEKDNYITLLQDRLCEAIVDLKNKDSEIRNHSNKVKKLINNYEEKKKFLQESLKIANSSTEKLEEYKIKQQETMKQLMKLIEFLQDKLEKINKK